MTERKKLYSYYSKEAQLAHKQRILYQDEGHKRLLQTHKHFLNKILKNHSVCLDVGCAEGLYASIMGKRAKFVLGIDISIERLKTASKETIEPNVEYIHADWDYMPFKDESFDVVLFSEGPEHSLNPFVTLSEIKRITKVDGYLSISAPIYPKYLFIAKKTKWFSRLISRLKLPFLWGSKSLIEHKNVFTPFLLKKLVRRAGFKLEKCILNPRPLGNLRVGTWGMILARKITI